MKQQVFKRIFIMAFLVMLLFIGVDVIAQCPMCRMSAESNLQNGGTAGRGLNNGIMYMLAMPYVIVGVIGYVWYRNSKRRRLRYDEIYTA